MQSTTWLCLNFFPIEFNEVWKSLHEKQPGWYLWVHCPWQHRHDRCSLAKLYLLGVLLLDFQGIQAKPGESVQYHLRVQPKVSWCSDHKSWTKRWNWVYLCKVWNIPKGKSQPTKVITQNLPLQPCSTNLNYIKVIQWQHFSAKLFFDANLALTLSWTIDGPAGLIFIQPRNAKRAIFHMWLNFIFATLCPRVEIHLD